MNATYQTFSAYSPPRSIKEEDSLKQMFISTELKIRNDNCGLFLIVACFAPETVVARQAPLKMELYNFKYAHTCSNDTPSFK